MINIVHIQFSVESGGRAAYRIQQIMDSSNSGTQSHILSLMQSQKKIGGIFYMNAWARKKARIDNKLQAFLTRNVQYKYGSFSFPLLGNNVAKLKVVKQADIIYIHWALNGFLNFKSFEKIAQLNKPVIIFMHDMWPVTGGCHHSFNCDKYKTTGCSSCYMFNTAQKNDLAAREFTKKLNLYNRFSNLHFVAPSKWLLNCAKQSLLTAKKPLHYIPNILDDTFYKPADKNKARQLLNISTEETVISFGAISVSSPYKGWAYLQKALELLKERKPDNNISVLIFGSVYNKEVADAIPFKTKFMGYLDDESITATVYNAADVFVAPSLAEAFGYVVMEALCCGTPVVGFEVGGIPDLILHKQNGYLSNYKDAEDLANGIEYCLVNKTKGYLPAELATAKTLEKHLELINSFAPNNK